MSDKKRQYVRKMKVWTVTDEDDNVRLFRARTSAEIVSHITPLFLIEPASHDDIISLMAAGVPVETVGLPEAVPAEAAGLTD